MNERGSRKMAGRVWGGILAVVTLIATAACGGSVATPTPSPAPTSSPRVTMPSTPSPMATLLPSPTGGLPTFATNFELAMGKAAKVTPADDSGAGAGAQINTFGLALLRHLDPKGNLVFSPTSIALALAMVEPGARGETLAQLDALLGGLGSDSSGAELQALLGELQAGGNVWQDTSGEPYYIGPNGQPLFPEQVLDPKAPQMAQLTLSNQGFFQKGMHFESTYLDALSARFGAGAGLLDYIADPDAARRTINKWVSDRTHGLIPEILQPDDVDQATRMDLVNTLYLDAHWASQFDPKQTKARQFYLSGGRPISVPTMAMDSEYVNYQAGSGWRAVTLQYQNACAMTIVVPNDMSSFVASLDQKKLESLWAMNPKEYLVHLTMPKFSTTTRANLTQTLSSMGIPDAFDRMKADLSGVDGQRDLFLARVIHQANIKVDEHGTVAAAATIVGASTTGGGPIPPEMTFHVDHPFLYFIRDTRSGAVLFLGRVDDPSLAG